jgi:hypothetical protein
MTARTLLRHVGAAALFGLKGLAGMRAAAHRRIGITECRGLLATNDVRVCNKPTSTSSNIDASSRRIWRIVSEKAREHMRATWQRGKADLRRHAPPRTQRAWAGVVAGVHHAASTNIIESVANSSMTSLESIKEAAMAC